MEKNYIEYILKQKFFEGNRVKILYAGNDTFDSILKNLHSASKIICLQFYIFRNDDTGKYITEILRKKSAEGVKIYILYDHFGSFGTPRSFWSSLRNSGIHVGASRPFKISAPLKYIRRDHRKLIIIDNAIAFTGGLNIANEYSGFHLRRRLPWRDTGILLEGPVVKELFNQFKRSWRLWTGTDIYDPTIPSPLKEKPTFFEDGYPCIPVFASSFRGSRRFRKLLYYSINNSKETIFLTTAYFIPGLRLLNSLVNAAQRRVDVRILLPSISDVPAAYYAGRAFYTKLLKAGVRIYHYKGVVLHAKSYIFDGVLSIVGSANLDAQSLIWNDEGNVGVFSRDFAEQMQELFFEDLKHSIEISLKEWIKRPFYERIKEQFFVMFKKRL